jgi:molybdenum ABC transporter molybdate-binding protein
MRPLTSLLLACLLLLSACPAPKPAADTPRDPVAPAGDPSGTADTPDPAGSPAIAVVADPALQPALADLGSAFAQLHPGGINTSYVERGALLTEIETWKADPAAMPPVVIAPDPGVLKALRAGGLIDEPTLRTFAGDRLALVQKAGDQWSSPSLHDINRLKFKQLGVGSNDTIAGYYGRQALISDGVYDNVAARILEYASLEALVAGVASGRCELGMALVSATISHPEVTVALLPGADLHEDIRYQIAATVGHAADPGVAELLRFIAEDAGAQATLAGYGFVPRAQAIVEQR